MAFLDQLARKYGYQSAKAAGFNGVVCAHNGDDHAFGNAALVRDGQVVADHVTDQPERVLKMLERGHLLVSGRDPGKFGDYGPGFYVSAIPQIWISRAGGKWNFLSRLTAKERWLLGRKLLHDRHLERGYVTADEIERARRDIGQFIKNGNYLVHLAEQPYNIRFWEASYLTPLGIVPGKQPDVVEVRAVGCFVEFAAPPRDARLLYALIESGHYEGGFVRSGMHEVAQMVLWKNSAVIQFGSWRRT